MEKKLNLQALILMIFTSVFGFTNIPRSFFLMGYAAIPWYIISALLFFIPYAFMMAEYGAAFKNESGGIYSWMEKSVNRPYAFIGTFMWYASYIIWMVNMSSSIWIVISTAIFGKDTTKTWSILGLNSTQTLGLMGVILMIVITIVACCGLKSISFITSIGGLAVTFLNVILLIGAILVFIFCGGLQHPIKELVGAFVHSPHPEYQTSMKVFSFMVFSIFAFGGIEVIGGLTDKTENAETTFPKGVTIAAIVIALGYAIGIFLCGVAVNWNKALGGQGVHMGNVAYILMQNLGYNIAHGFGASESSAVNFGLWMARYTGISMACALTGAFFTLVFSPLKQLIEGTKEMWPEFLKREKNGMLVNAMIVQCIIVVVFVILISFGGEGAEKFFNKLILMTNVAMTIPYMFIAGAFPFFKSKKEIEKPFEIYKSDTAVKVATFSTVALVLIANLATIISPALEGNVADTLWMIAGPVVFTLVAIVLIIRHEKK